MANGVKAVPIREWCLMFALSAAALASAYFSWWSMNLTETWAFVTGGVCVWLVVRENIWNWPIGILNNIFFFVVFYRSGLYADTGLQVIYLVLGIYGWIEWVYGGENRKALQISHTRRWEWIAIAIFIPLTTWIFMNILLKLNGAAPFWDAVTTVISLAAQYLLCRKRFENWYFWIVADIIYVPLYLSKNLSLTAFLYSIFLIMCFQGIREWKKLSLTQKSENG